ncbi:MAG: TonB-dependent receptor, partial [Bacteroidetes bacterium]
PANNRSYFYPSASLSWVVSETFRLPKIISFSKIRLNASQVGADTWAYQLEKSFYNLNRFGNIYEASVENTLKNPNLKPTRINQYEAGMDLRMFGNRLSIDLAVYTGTAFDQITPINTASSTGYTRRYVNVGEISNKGIELAMSLNPVQTVSVDWNIGLTYSRNINEVVSLAKDVDALPIGYAYSGLRTEARPGLPYGNIIGYGLKRDPEGNIVHVNGLPVRTDSEMILGNFTPDWIGGVTSSLTFKDFTLSVLVNGKFGGELFSNTTQWLRQYGMDKSTDVPMRQDYIVGEGVTERGGPAGEVLYEPNHVSVAFFDYAYWMNAYGLHETNMFDASYIKLKEVKLGYQLPSGLVQRTPFRQVRISVVGRNLALLYARIPHIDPETAISADNSKQGYEMFNMPSSRSLTASILVKF